MCNGALQTKHMTSKLECARIVSTLFLREMRSRSMSEHATQNCQEKSCWMVELSLLRTTLGVIIVMFDARVVPTSNDKHPHLRAACARAQPPSKAFPSHFKSLATMVVVCSVLGSSDWITASNTIVGPRCGNG